MINSKQTEAMQHIFGIPFQQPRIKQAVLWLLNLVNLGFFVWLLAQVYSCQIGLSPASFCPYGVEDSIPTAIGLVFVAVAFVVILQNRPGIEALFFIWGAGTVIVGVSSGSYIPINLIFFNCYLIFYGPITLHFNLALHERPLRKLEAASLALFYALALILSIAYMIIVFNTSSFPSTIFNMARSATRIFYGAAVIWTIYLMWEGYHHFSSLSGRRRIRLMVIGIFLAIMPLIFLTIIPQILGIGNIISAVDFPWLLLIPFFYLYSTFRARLGYAENTFRAILVYFVLGIVYITAFMITSQLQYLYPNGNLRFYPIIGVAFIMIVTFMPLRRRVYSLIDWAFYGNETDYKTSLDYLEGLLASVLNRKGVTFLLLDELMAAIKPTRVILFLRQNELCLTYAGSKGLTEDPLVNLRLFLDTPLAAKLTQLSMPTSTVDIKKDIAGEKLTSDEDALMAAPDMALWIPLVSDDILQGLILLSLREGDDLYTEKDKKLLSYIIPKAGAAIRNVLLAEGILAGKEELAQAHYRLITGQEEERKRIARELHDDTIQQLLGISYQIAEIKNRLMAGGAAHDLMTSNPIRELDGVRDHIADAISGVRSMINGLRPAGLDEFGIRLTLENMIEQYRSMSGNSRLVFFLDIDPEVDNLPDLQSICIYRIFQEALRNIIEHADASHVFMELACKSDQINLIIEDDGKGFVVPERLSELALADHFGLIGIQERTRSLGGTGTVTSVPGKGTKITIMLPQNERHQEL